MVVTRAESEDGAGGTEPVPSPGAALAAGQGTECATGRDVDVIIVWLWNAKNDRKEPVRFACWIFLHPKGFSSLLFVGQAPRSYVADGERGPRLCPSGFPLDH